MENFEDLAWLFHCNNRNRGTIRCNLDESALLWKTVKRTAGPILEIGRCRGGSTILISVAADKRKVYSVDLEPVKDPKINDYLIDNNVSVIIDDSRKPINESFGMIFFDGDHTYEGIVSDIKAHWKNLKDFGNGPPQALFHDAVRNDGLKYDNLLNHCPEVKLACRRLIESGAATKIEKAGSMLTVEKIAELPPDFGE